MNKPLSSSDRKVYALVAMVAVVAVAAVVVSTSPAWAQAAPPDASTGICNILGYVLAKSVRIAVALVAVVVALLNMWQEQSNIGTWIQKHKVAFIFVVALVALPTVAAYVIGQSACSSWT